MAFYDMTLGRESMSGHWCFLCKLSHTKYSDKLSKDGVMWILEDLEVLGKKLKDGKLKPKEGVKQPLWWDFLPVEHYMIPLLHVLIGISNDLLDQFWEWVNEEIESWDQQEYRTRRAVTKAEHKVINKIAARDEWDGTADGMKLKFLKGMVNRRKRSWRNWVH